MIFGLPHSSKAYFFRLSLRRPSGSNTLKSRARFYVLKGSDGKVFPFTRPTIDPCPRKRPQKSAEKVLYVKTLDGVREHNPEKRSSHFGSSAKNLCFHRSFNSSSLLFPMASAPETTETPAGVPRSFGPPAPEAPNPAAREEPEPFDGENVENPEAPEERAAPGRLTQQDVAEILGMVREQEVAAAKEEKSSGFKSFVFFCFSVIVAFSLIGFSSSHDLTGPEVEVTGTTTKEKDLTIGAKAVWSSSFVVCSLAFCCVVTSYVDCYSGLKSKRELLVPVFVFGLLVLGMISYYYFGQPLPFLFMVPTLNLLATLLPMLTEAKIIDPITHQCVVSAYGQLTMLVSGGGLRLALDPRANLMFLTCVVKYFTGVTVTAMFSDATTSPTKAVGSVLFTISLVVSSEFLAVATGTLPQGSRSNPFRPSSFYFFANCRGFVSKAGAAFTESDEKIEIGEDAGEAKNFLQRIKELASSLESLPTGSRMRSQALSGTVCGLFCQVDVCIAIANSGLGAKINVSRSTRQTSSEQSGLKLSRALFGKVIGSSQFNGVGAAFPEVGLARLLRGETVSPSLLTLDQSMARRLMTEAALSFGLGSGAAKNPLLSIRQSASATNQVALGFSSIAESYARKGGFVEDSDWAFGLALVISLALSAIASNLNATLSNSLKTQSENGMAMSDFNCAFCANRLQNRLINLISDNSRLKSAHYKLKVVEVSQDIFSNICRELGFEIKEIEMDNQDEFDVGGGPAGPYEDDGAGKDDSKIDNENVRRLIEMFEGKNQKRQKVLKIQLQLEQGCLFCRWWSFLY